MGTRQIMRSALLVAAVFGWTAVAAQAAPVVHPKIANKDSLRVLLTGSAMPREAQFLRVLLIRAMDKKKAELALYVQPSRGQTARVGVVADLLPERRLKHFPEEFSKPRGSEEAKHNNLAAYNLIVAFDLDWKRLKKAQLLALRQWVTAGGGLVVVAGSVHSHQLAGAADTDEGKIARALLPVVMDKAKDKGERDKPWRLNFNVKEKDVFLKLDSKGKGPLAGWAEFFTDSAKPARNAEVVRGFYNYHAVKSVKKTATVLATLADPAAKLPTGKEQPYLVTMPVGKGRVVYLSSGELWRLREFREEAHERLWFQLLWYALGVEKLAG
jgi:uncharacterized membrane protein